ncbi:MAG: DUF4126 domain-containing protein [Deltaproteobacteria bacterium]|nr:DUF4126 domain-containing protein [Deltaproteobacteria bacterium]MBW2666872.1 DUF4126 domain-containing protein [Deltaproteobacteria bacterium]
MGVVETIALTMGIGWASGINLYATICMLGLLGTTGHLALPPDLVLLQDPMVIFVAGAMYLIEFFADKIPGIDTGWDVIHTFIRIPAGAILAAGAIGDLAPGAELAAALAGGTLAAGAHATKAGTRAIINASPEPITNWTASILEDVAVIGGLWTALQNPVLFLVGLAAFFALAIWLLPKIWRGLQRIFGYLKRKLGGAPEIPEDVATD